MPSGLPPPAGGISFTRRTKVFQIRAAERHPAALHSSLFTLPALPLFPPGRTAKQKYILFFGHLTHNSERYNIGLNLIMEGKEYGKTGSA